MIKCGSKSRLFLIRVTLLLILPWLFLGGPGYEASRSFKEAWNLGHVLLFFLLAIECERWLKTRIAATGARALVIMALALSAAVLIEIAQSVFPGRIVSSADVVNSGAGALVALLCLYSLRRAGHKKRLSVSAVIFILVLVTIPLFHASLDEYRARRDFPLLADFESALEVSRWEKNKKVIIERVKNPVSSGDWSLQVVLGIEKYSGIGLHYFPGNWTGMKELRFQVFNPDEPVVLHFRVHDREHRGENQLYDNRYNGRQLLVRGWNQIIVPIADIESAPHDRRMDLAYIEGFGFFLVDNPEERILYVDRVELIADTMMD